MPHGSAVKNTLLINFLQLIACLHICRQAICAAEQAPVTGTVVIHDKRKWITIALNFLVLSG
jgi:hypothetical protein